MKKRLTVKELIEKLTNCDPSFEVTREDNEYDLIDVNDIEVDTKEKIVIIGSGPIY